MRIYDGTDAEAADATRSELCKVGIADFAVTTDGAVLTTSGLGSCIGVALYDPVAGVAGLVHVMLPTAEGVDGNRAKFADTGIEALVDAMEDDGADRDRFTAKIAGGSEMLTLSENGSTVGSRNVDQVRETLASYDIPVEGEDLGGDHGRSLKFEGATGDLVVKSASRDGTTL